MSNTPRLRSIPEISAERPASYRWRVAFDGAVGLLVDAGGGLDHRLPDSRARRNLRWLPTAPPGGLPDAPLAGFQLPSDRSSLTTLGLPPRGRGSTATPRPTSALNLSNQPGPPQCPCPALEAKCPTGRWRPAGLSRAMRGSVSYAAFEVTEGATTARRRRRSAWRRGVLAVVDAPRPAGLSAGPRSAPCRWRRRV